MGRKIVNKKELMKMIKNCLCNNCKHANVCKKMYVLQKFDDENKKFIGINITMDSCEDYEQQ